MSPSPGAGAAPREALEPRRASLSYVAPPDCPRSEGFVEQVQSRATRLQLEPESRAASPPEQVHVLVEPDPSGAGWLGELRIVGPSALVREVRGAKCDDVVAALALITVLRLERSDGSLAGTAGATPATTAAGEQTPSEVSTAGPSPEATDAESATAGAEAVEPSTPEAPPTPDDGPTPGTDVEERTPAPELAVEERAPADAATGDLADRTAEPSSPAATSADADDVDDADDADDADDGVDGARSDDANRAGSLEVETQLFGHLGYSSMPSHAFKAALGAELRLGESVESWSGALSLALARGNDLSPDGTSELTLLTAELRLCPPGVLLDAGFSLRACAQLSAGRLDLSLSPSRRLATFDQKRPWVALGPSVDAGLPLSSRWTLRATSALMIHLIRDTFGRAPVDDADPDARVPLYRPEALSLELLLGIGYTF